MEFTTSRSTAAACISGLAALYWCCFSGFWANTYFQARRKQVSQQTSSHVPFHINALLYQLLSIIFYVVNCLYEALPATHQLKLLNQVCFALYMPAAYLVGMSFCLGFGTLFARIPWCRLVILGVTFMVVLLACCLSFVDSDSTFTAAVTIFICAFFLQLLANLHTICSAKRLYRQTESSAYRIVLDKHLRNLWKVLGLLTSLFLLSTAGEIVRRVGSSDAAEVALWAGFVVCAAVVNGWVLYLMRPREEIRDAEVLQRSLHQPLSPSHRSQHATPSVSSS